jgi:hypothetical protein
VRSCRERTSPACEGRSGRLSDILLGAASALFPVLLVTDLVGRFG